MILILYHQKPRQQRKAISNHLLAFGKNPNVQVEYWNVAYGLPSVLANCGFDAVLFHFTFFLPNINKKFDHQFRHWGVLKQMNVPKSALVQDEYVNTQSICNFLKEFNVETVFTCLPESLHQIVYPSSYTGVKHFHTVLTGYIDEEFVTSQKDITKSHSNRSMDIVYRARKMPYNLGIFGTYKSKLTDVFLAATSKETFSVDLSNDPNDFIFGDDWFRFVGDSRTILGCEGGASLHDPDGTIRACCNKILNSQANTDFEQVKEICFKNQDEKFPYYAISPRHFEAAILKTCQVLLEGQYNGILQADVHYIPIKKDFSNIDDVMEKIKNIPYCQQMAEKTYEDIVLSGRYNYQYFINFVLQNVLLHSNMNNLDKSEQKALKKLKYLNLHPYLVSPFLYIRMRAIETVKKLIWWTGIDKMLWFKKVEYLLFGSNAVR